MCWEELDADGRRPASCPVTYINSAAAIRRSAASTAASSARRRTPRPRSSGLRARRAGAVLARPAPRPQHRLQDGRAARRRWRVGSARAVGGLDAEQLESARMMLWKGHCSVHARFTVAQIESVRDAASRRARDRAPGVPLDVRAGRRRQRLDRVHHQARCSDSPAGSVWAVGTEVHLVNRLARRGRARTDRAVARSVRLPVLDDVPRVAEPPALDPRRAGRGEVHNRIVVPDEQKHWTKRRAGSDAVHSLTRALERPATPVSDTIRRFASDCRRTRRTSDGSRASAASVRRSTRSSRTSTRRRWRSITASITRPTSTT